MQYPYESLIFNLFFWLFIFLGFCFVVTGFVILRKKDIVLNVLKKRAKPVSAPLPKFSPKRASAVKLKTPAKAKPSVQAKGPSQPKYKSEPAPSDSFSEKLGDKVVQYMIEVSQSDDAMLVKDRMEKILNECERLNSLDLPDENKKIISTVLLWCRRFDIERHISEIKLFRKSTQIVYDFGKHDFKLRISGE